MSFNRKIPKKNRRDFAPFDEAAEGRLSSPLENCFVEGIHSLARLLFAEE